MELKNTEIKTEIKKDEKGATMVEYAMMVALVAAVCITAVTSIGTAGKSSFTNIAAQMDSANN